MLLTLHQRFRLCHDLKCLSVFVQLLCMKGFFIVRKNSWMFSHLVPTSNKIYVRTCTCIACLWIVFLPLKCLLSCYRTDLDLTHVGKTDQPPSLPMSLQSHSYPLLGNLKIHRETHTKQDDRFPLNLILPRLFLLLSFTLLSFPVLNCYSSCCWVLVTQIIS